MFLHSFHHKILFDLLATVVRYIILNLFLTYKLQPPIRSTTFGLIICSYCFIFYGVLHSGLPVYKTCMPEIYDSYSGDHI